jgi:basic membrane protein A
MTRIRRRAPGFSTALHTLLLLTLACTRASDTAKTDSASSASGAFRVALLTPGPISDQSWNAGAYAGLMQIQDSLGAQVSHIQTKTPAEFDENFRQYGSQGYALVFGHGFEFQDAAKRVAPLYPKTAYVISSSQAAQEPNVAGLQFAFSEASYLAGLAAGALTKSGVIGTIGGTELPPVVESFRAFEQGARESRPGVLVVKGFIGNWVDVSAGREQALAQIAQGADVIFQNADAAGLGVFQAARETKKALVIGSNSNQNDVAPEITIGSVVIDLPHAFLTVARAVKDGTFAAHAISLGTESRVVTFVINPTLAGRLSTPMRVRLDSLQAQMFAGTYRLRPDSARPR